MIARADAFPEYDQLLALLDAASHVLDCRVVCEAAVQGHRFGVHVASLGSRDPLAPAIGIFGGIHGLERIGTQLVLDYLRSVLGRLAWDELLHRELQAVRLVFMPIVNPGGRPVAENEYGPSNAGTPPGNTVYEYGTPTVARGNGF